MARPCHARLPARRIAGLGVLLALLCIWAGPPDCVAADDPDPPLLVPSRTTLSRLRWLQYHMVAGRVVASGENMTFGPANLGGRQRERLEIHVHGALVDLRYELTAPDDQLTLAIAGDDRFLLRRTRPEAHYALQFEQAAGKPVVVSLELPTGKKVVHGESFWHVYLADPELIRRHVGPVFELLHPSWRLAALGAVVEDTLVQRAPHMQRGDSERWSRLIDALGSPEFAVRETTQRNLLTAGPTVLPYLQQLDRSRLDAEQAARVRSLIDQLSAHYEDTADRVAVWLVWDWKVWMSLLERDELIKRRVAVDQLQKIWDTTIDFDPAASPEQRQQQLAKLRIRFPQEPPPAVQMPVASPETPEK